MGGIENGLITERKNFCQAVVEEPGHLLFAIGVKVCASHIADKKRITGKHADGLVAEVLIVNGEGQAVVGVSRRFQHFHSHGIERELCALPHSIGVGDLARGIGSVMDRGPGELCQDRRTGNQVLVAMGLKNIGNATAPLASALGIDLAVTARIDHGGLAAVANEIRDLGESW